MFILDVATSFCLTLGDKIACVMVLIDAEIESTMVAVANSSSNTSVSASPTAAVPMSMVKNWRYMPTVLVEYIFSITFKSKIMIATYF